MFLLIFILALSATASEGPTLEKLKEMFPSEAKMLGPESFAAIGRILTGYEAVRAGEAPTMVNGRLTLTTSVPVTTSDVTAASTIYFTPYHGNRIALYSGTAWQLFTFTEKSIAVPSTTSTPFDIFAYNNSGTVALETVDWTNTTTRATALTQQDGVYVKSGATTRRYLGSAATTTVSGQTEDSASKRLVWNLYNQVTRSLYRMDNTSSWSYASAAFRNANGSATNQVQMMSGLSDTYLHLDVRANVVASANTQVALSIGEDTTGITASPGWYAYQYLANGTRGEVLASIRKYPGTGFHYYQWSEYAEALVTFLGTVSGLNSQMTGFTRQ